MVLDFMLAKEYVEGMKAPRKVDNYTPPVGWLMSEKLDGYRARYNLDTKSFVSRQNKPFNAPTWFLGAIWHNLDGELFAGRDDFQGMGVVRKKVPIDEEWFKIKYYVYDLPEITEPFNERYELLKKVVSDIEENWSTFVSTNPKLKDVTCPVVLCEHTMVESIDHMKTFYKSVLDTGGEGIMLKDPKCSYDKNRSNHLLKYKPKFDSEAIIVGYKDGSNKYEGMLGSFICEPLINHDSHQEIDGDINHRFATSGMNDDIRKSYLGSHPIGTIITYEYSGFTKSGKPRFARYLRIRDDVVINMVEEAIPEAIPKEVIPNPGNEVVKKCIFMFERIAVYEKAMANPFKAKAYKTAINQLKTKNDSDLISENLIQVKGIGKSIVEKIETIIHTGTLQQYEDIKDFEDPKEIFMKIHGVGSVKANQLVTAGFKSITELINCENIKEYLNDVQMKGIKWYGDILHSIPRDEIICHEEYLKGVLHSIDPTAELTIAGSFRRGKAQSGDIDMLINTPSVKNNSVYNKFIDELFKQGYLLEELSRGPKKFMGMSKGIGQAIARRIDIMYTKPIEYPFAILYFTGSMEFNVKMRTELLEQGLSLNEYGIKKDKKNVKHECKTEKEVFKYLGYDYVEPENR